MGPTELFAREPTYTIACETVDLCVDKYIALMAEAWDTIPLNVPLDRSGASGQFWQIGPCMVSIITVPPCIYETKRTHLENRGPLIGLKKQISGFEYGDYVDGEYHCVPGPIQIGDPHSVGRGIGTAQVIQEIYAPRPMLGLSPSSVTRSEKIYATSTIGKIIHAEWDLLLLTAQSGAAQIPKRTIERFLAAFMIALGVPPQREDVRTQARELLFRQIQRFINASLRTPDLDTNAILARFGLSRASLYRMFEPLGGIRSYITHLRASKALLEIWENRTVRGSVAAARERWHFQTGNDFNRTVTRVFGNSPRRLLSMDAPTRPHLGASASFAFEFIDMRYAGPGDLMPA
ncbi:MAG: hypothetical protein AAFR51_07480 [Pseudomonadota bacterium]